MLRRVGPVLAALLGLVLAGLIGYVPYTTFVDLGFQRLQPLATVLFSGYVAAAVFLFFGALLTAARMAAGPALLIAGGVVAAAAVALEPAMVFGGVYRYYFTEIAALEGMEAISRAAGLVLGPLTAAAAALPATFRHVRTRAS